VLSFDNKNIINYNIVKNFYKKDKIKFSFTGTPEEFNFFKQKFSFDIFFNITKTKQAKQLAKSFKEQCPCDSGLLAHNAACTYCNKCWRSSVTKI